MTESPPATALVRKLAAQHGVDLGPIAGTGVGGRIRKQDVLDAAGVSAISTRTVRGAVSVPARPKLPVLMDSYWSRTREQVTVDVYGLNPLIDDMRQINPQMYSEALARGGQPPTLFVTGDLPLFTASGTEPRLLLQLPWVVRHAAASASLADAAVLFETYGAPTEGTWNDALMQFCLEPPVLTYESRLHAWGGPNVF